MNLKDRLMKRREEQLDLGDGTIVYMRELAYSAVSKLRPTDDDQGETEEGNDVFAFRVLVACTYDANGERVFSEEDIDELRDGPAGTINKLVLLALQVNGLGGVEESDAEGN